MVVTRKILTAVVGLGLGAGLVATATSAAAAAQGGVTFWASASFTGTSVTLPAADGCTALPFVAHAELNESASGIDVYATTDCSGPALHFPTADIHSFAGFDGRSFRASS
ncbi:hypothetical protein [Isoptericola sp. NPDC057559]|uniref:hypothetical protein n=1 Tax=Isoptericola sp. NPDC057559 TaxID=3346168 RepID=UPI003686649C